MPVYLFVCVSHIVFAPRDTLFAKFKEEYAHEVLRWRRRGAEFAAEEKPHFLCLQSIRSKSSSQRVCCLVPRVSCLKGLVALSTAVLLKSS